MRREPPLPGEILRGVLKRRELLQQELADLIERPHQMVSDIVGGKTRITGRTALDFEDALGVSAEYWMFAQTAHDLFIARQRRADGVTVRGRATR